MGVITYDDDVVQTANRIYKAQVSVPNSGEPKTVYGFIVGLKDKDSDEGEILDAPGFNEKQEESEEARFNKDRVVTIVRQHVTVGKRVHFSLGEGDYKKACDAHRDKHEVWASGQYKRKFGKWILDPCEAFGMAGEPPPPTTPPGAPAPDPTPSSPPRLGRVVEFEEDEPPSDANVERVRLRAGKIEDED